MSANDLIFSPGYLKTINTPILMALGGKELYADNDAQREVCLKLPACRLIEFTDGMHELLQERDVVRTPWLDSITAFITQTVTDTKPR
jgi:alpha-beta hydrolase superfamily lysophospholipase